MSNTGFKGLSVRQTGNQLVFRSSLKALNGSKIIAGSTTLTLYEYQSDGTLKSYDFNDNTFKTTALTTATLSLTHRTGNNSTTNTGIWTGSLSVLSGFTTGAVYVAQVNNTNASPPDQEFEFQYGSAEGDLLTVVGATGLASLVSNVIPNGIGTATAGASTTITLQTDIGDSRGLACIIEIIAGTGAGQVRGVASYATATKILTVDRAWLTNPDATSFYAIYVANYSPLDGNLRAAAASVAATVTATLHSIDASGNLALLKLLHRVPNAGNVWIVDPTNGSSGGSGTWTAPYDTLLTWLANASWQSGDTVLLMPGTQAFGNNTIVIPDGINVIGTSRKGCIITSTAVFTSKGCIYSPGSNSYHANFTITAVASQPASLGTPTFQACLGAYGNSQGFTNALVEGVDLNGGTDCIYLDSGLKTTSLRVRDVQFTTGWDFVAVENFFSGSNTNGNVVVNNTLYLENFTAYCVGANSGGLPYLPEQNALSFGVNCVNEWKGAAGELNHGSVAVYLRNGYISTYTTDALINSRPLAVRGPLATIDADGVTIEQFNSGGGPINDAYADSSAAGKCYLKLANCQAKYSTISVDANSTLTTRDGLTSDAGFQENYLSATQSFNNAGQTTAIPATFLPAAAGTAPTSPTPAFDGVGLEFPINYPVSQPFTISGLDSTGWTQFVFTVKATAGAADSAALVTVVVSNPGVGTDGLILLNGAAPSGSNSNADGTLTVNGVTTNTSLTLTLTARGHALAAGNSYVWEITRYSGSSGTKYMIGQGNWAALPSVRINPVAS